jgi:hypothetical protein
MNWKRVVLHVVSLLCLVLWVEKTTHAAESQGEQVLVIGVVRGHAIDPRLTKELSEHFARSSGLQPAALNLSATERLCGDAGCMDGLGSKAGAQIVVSAAIQQSTPAVFFITMALLDRIRSSPFQDKALCDQCSQDALQAKLADLADKLLQQSREARLMPSPAIVPVDHVPTIPVLSPDLATSPTGQIPPAPPISPPKRFVSKLTLQRKIALGVMGGLAGAALITSITLVATHRQPAGPNASCGPTEPQICGYDNRLYYGLGFGATGALTLGIVGALVWP